MDQSYKSGETFIGRELLVKLDKSGDGTLTDVFMNFVYQPVFNSNRLVEGISVFAFEVTDLVLSRRQLESVNQSLKRSNEELQSFAYIASHDLQEPLRTLASYSQLLAKRYQGQLDQDADEFIGFIVSSAKRMQCLIEDVLNHSMIQKSTGAVGYTDPETVLEFVRDNLKDEFAENNACLKFANLPAVKVEREHLAGLFENLISNAIKYRRGDIEPLIEILVHKQGDEYRFQVSDNGIGIDPEYYSKVFEIFQRLHGRDQFAGTGIGLASCKKNRGNLRGEDLG